MTLLNPIALLYSLLIGVLLVLHFFRRSPRAYWVSNLMLWDATGTSKDERLIFQKIKRSLLLILQILFLLAVVFALARPAIHLWGSQPRSIVLVIDCSASMAAREGGKTRFELMRSKAGALIDQIGTNDRVLIVQARPQPVVDSYWGSDKTALGRALASLSVTQAPADVYGALILGLSSIPKTDPYEAFVFSDGTQAALLPERLPSERIHYIQTGETEDNIAITRLAIRSNPFSAYDQEAYVEVANFSNRTQEFQLELSLEGSVLKHEAFRLKPQERIPLIAALPPGGVGVVRASIDARDALDTDNQAYAVISPGTISVLLATDGNLFLEKVLKANPRIEYSVISPEEFPAPAPRKPHAVAILDGFAPPDRPPGNYLIINDRSGVSGERRSVLRSIRNLVLPHPKHPITTFVDLANVSVDEALPLPIGAGGAVLIEGMGKPLLVASEDGAFRTVRIGFDFRASNLPLTVSFPVLMSNILDWLSAVPDEPGHLISAGAPWHARVPNAGAVEAVITTPQGKMVKSSLAGSTITFVGTETAGVYTVRCGDFSERFAVNLFSEAESSIAPAFKAAGANASVTVQATLARNGLEIWRLLLYAALLLLILEWSLSFL